MSNLNDFIEQLIVQGIPPANQPANQVTVTIAGNHATGRSSMAVVLAEALHSLGFKTAVTDVASEDPPDLNAATRNLKHLTSVTPGATVNIQVLTVDRKSTKV